VAGIIAMFVPLGVIAGQSGVIFGSVLQNRWVVLGMAALFLTSPARCSARSNSRCPRRSPIASPRWAALVTRARFCWALPAA